MDKKTVFDMIPKASYDKLMEQLTLRDIKMSEFAELLALDKATLPDTIKFPIEDRRQPHTYGEEYMTSSDFTPVNFDMGDAVSIVEQLKRMQDVIEQTNEVVDKMKENHTLHQLWGVWGRYWKIHKPLYELDKKDLQILVELGLYEKHDTYYLRTPVGNFAKSLLLPYHDTGQWFNMSKHLFGG